MIRERFAAAASMLPEEEKIAHTENGHTPKTKQRSTPKPTMTGAKAAKLRRCLSAMQAEPCVLSVDPSGLADGPASYSEVERLPGEVLQHMAKARPDLAKAFVTIMSRRVWCSTSYSGMGCFEAVTQPLNDSASRLHAALAQGLPCPPATCKRGPSGFQLWSACDNAAVPRCALLCHHPSSRAKHVFGDLVERVAEPLRSHLVRLQAKCIAEHRAAARLKKKVERVDKEAVGLKMLETLLGHLKDATWEDSAYCYACDRRCPLEPDLHGDDVWLEVAGVVCLAWSTMRRGSLGSWLHESTLPCLVWLMWLKQSKVNFAVVECVRGFDYKTALKIVFPEFNGFCIKFSPSHLGVPSTRWRSYTWLWRSDAFACSVERPLEEFTACFARKLVMTADSYLLATPSQIEADFIARMKKRSLVVQSPSELNGQLVLPPACLQRLMEYSHLARDRVSGGTAVEGVVNLAQTASYAGFSRVPNGCVGALLRKSVLYDLKADRPYVINPECLAVQGWPLLGDQVTEKYAPWGVHYGNLFAHLDEQQVQGLLGNGMHLAAVSAAVVFGFGTMMRSGQTMSDLE